jgi:hypothetical protein
MCHKVRSAANFFLFISIIGVPKDFVSADRVPDLFGLDISGQEFGDFCQRRLCRDSQFVCVDFEMR